jgi:UPF0716 protein FxsA
MTFVGRFFLAVLALGFVEVLLLVKVAGAIGFLGTLGLCVLTAMVGGSLVRHQGLQTLRSIQTAMSQGEAPASEIVAGLVLLVAGVLLVVPGFVTDAVGFLALIPSLRRRLAAWAARRFGRSLPSQVFTSGPRPPGARGGRVIDVDPDD